MECWSCEKVQPNEELNQNILCHEAFEIAKKVALRNLLLMNTQVSLETHHTIDVTSIFNRCLRDDLGL